MTKAKKLMFAIAGPFLGLAFSVFWGSNSNATKVNPYANFLAPNAEAGLVLGICNAYCLWFHGGWNCVAPGDPSLTCYPQSGGGCYTEPSGGSC